MRRDVRVRLAVASGLVAASLLVAAARAPVRWVSTFAGANAGLMDGPAADARFYGPSGLVLDDRDPAAPVLYVADTYNHRIRRIDLAAAGGPRATTLAGAGGIGHRGGGERDGAGNEAQFSFPRDLALDGEGGLYVADTNNHRIRKVDLRDPAHRVTTVAGARRGFADGPGAAARFHNPWGLTYDGAGGLVVADTYNNRIRRVDLRDPARRVRTLAGGLKGYEDARGAAARFDAPVGVAVDPRRPGGPVYVADAANRCIRRIAADGVVTTLGGAPPTVPDHESYFVAIPLIYPAHVAFGPDGRLYASDQATNVVYRVGVDDGAIVALAGMPGKDAGLANGAVTWARFGQPAGLAISAAHGIFVADATNHCIRRLR